MNKVAKGLLLCASVAVGCYAGYMLASNQKVQEAVSGLVKCAVGESAQKAHAMTEEMMMRRAKVTNNPEINQRWVEQQWDAL